MKKLVTVSLFIFWAVVTAVLVAGLVFYQQNNATNQLPPSSNNSSGSLLPNNAGSAELILNLQEIVKHNLVQDCWLIISNKVYNVSSYLSVHPGGVGTILPYCGGEATQAFQTKDIGRPHSSYTASLLGSYYLGDLNQKISSQPSSNLQPNMSAQSPVSTPPNVAPSNAHQTGGNINLSLTEIAKHNSVQNCWLIISSKVYNVTSYLSVHPGGVGPILSYCGGEATQAFQTKDVGRSHSSYAANLLASYYIGNVGQTASSQSVQNTNSVQPPAGGGRGEYEDD